MDLHDGAAHGNLTQPDNLLSSGAEGDTQIGSPELRSPQGALKAGAIVHTVLMPSTASPRVDWLEVEALSRLMDTPSSLSALFQGCRVCSSSHSVATWNVCSAFGVGASRLP